MLDAPTLPCPDLPEPAVLRRVQAGAQTVVMFGEKVLFCYDRADTGMRTRAVVALTDAGARGKDVAGVFGLSPE